jgi:hypothetical protein
MDLVPIELTILIVVVWLALILWPLAVIGLLLGRRKDGFWRRQRRKLVVTLTASTLIIVVPILGSMILSVVDPEIDPDKQLMEAAVAKVKSEFANPKGVQVEEVWLGSQERFDTAVCGIVDSDEITNTSRFIYTTNLTFPPRRTDSGEKKGRIGDLIELDLPPTNEGSKPTDTAYWEKVAENLLDFNYQWGRLCEKTRPSADESEGG